MAKFVPRVRKQKALRRAATTPGDAASAHAAASSAHSSALELLPVSKQEREARRQQLREELRAARPESTTSGKKRKRLEKYIDTKLKKEENLDLIKKLADTKVDTSLFKSSKKLGRGSESKREKYGRVLREQRAGIADDGADDILFEERLRPHGNGKDGLATKDKAAQADSVPVLTPSRNPAVLALIAPTVPALSFGSGLKRPLETDDAGNPIIQKRQRIKAKSKGISLAIPPTEDTSEWEGFSTASESDEETVRRDEEDAFDSDADFGSSVDSSGDRSSDEADSDAGSDDSMSDATSEEDDDNMDAKHGVKERASAFKAWANQQRNQALGFTPSTQTDLLSLRSEHEQNERVRENDAGKITNGTRDGAAQSIKQNKVKAFIAPEVVPSTVRHVYNVSVTRSEAIQEARIALPVVAEEQKIMEVIHGNDSVIVWGATGSGKTTQVPQFLFEAGYGCPDGPTPGLIGVTQPRRVAAVSMAKRVAYELGDYSDRVGYQIRFDSSVKPKTAVKFMTDGILLREISQDFTLSKYSAIVLDEAHERSVNTDLLMGMLSRIVETRGDLSKTNPKFKPLKLIIMSATLSVSELTNNKFLFRTGIPPVVQAEGRQHPVTMHFARRTQRDYLEEAFTKVSRGHRKLPPGGFLVFLTGQSEIMSLSKRLKDAFASTDGSRTSYSNVRVSAAEASIEDEDVELNGESLIADYDDSSESETEIRGVDNDDDKEFDIGDDQPAEVLNVHVLPLYSQLPTDQQMKIFQPPPDNSRLIVLATNVAETSLTIPGIRYVFDCGRAKQKRYNAASGVQSFEVDWISKASASQRAGRAGRTGPGHCYRLYSSAVYERDFPEFAQPEITRVPVEGVVLLLKSMGIPNIANFPFPTPPDRQSLIKAEHLLSYLGAITAGKVTPIGSQLSAYPLSPRLSRILVQAHKEGHLDHAITLVSGLTVPDIFLPQSQLDMDDPTPTTDDQPLWTENDNIAAAARETRRKEYATFHAHVSRLDRSSDAIKLLTTICDFTHAQSSDAQALHPFHTFTRTKSLHEILQLRAQLSLIVATLHPGSVSATPAAKIPLPTTKQLKFLRGIVSAGYVDQVAIRADLSPTPPIDHPRKPKRVTDVPYITLFPSTTNDSAPSSSADPIASARHKYVYIHPSSILAHTTSPASLPQYLIYTHLSLSQPPTASSTLPPRTRIHPLTPTTAENLTTLARGTPLLEDGKPIGRIETLGRDAQGRERRAVSVVPFLKGAAGREWPLPPARRAVQVRVAGKGWVEEGG